MIKKILTHQKNEHKFRLKSYLPSKWALLAMRGSFVAFSISSKTTNIVTKYELSEPLDCIQSCKLAQFLTEYKGNRSLWTQSCKNGKAPGENFKVDIPTLAHQWGKQG